MEIKRKKVTFVARWELINDDGYVSARIEFAKYKTQWMYKYCPNIIMMEAVSEELFSQLKEKHL